MTATNKKTRNRNFEEESMVGLSWTVVEKGKFGHRRKTACCHKPTKVGEIILAAPAIRDGAVVATTFIHGKCLHAMLEGVPEDIDLVRARWNKIRAKFLAA